MRTILCVGFLSDLTFKYTLGLFERLARRVPFVVDLGVARNGFWAHYEEGGRTCRIRTSEVDLALHPDELSLYQRLTPVAQCVRTGTRAWKGFKLAHYVFERLLDHSFFDVVVNPWMAGWSNGARPIHYQFLTRIGFQVPSWLVTNDPLAARRFVAEYGGDVFVKSVGHSRTISRKFSEEHAGNIENLRNCPTLFQKAIHGPDIRVHVVGEQCFGVRITSRADDYRYAGDCPVEYTPTELPPKIASVCVEATRRLGLAFSGIDLKVCERTGEWYCFEANPMPGYSHYDRYLGGSIAAALVEYLENGHAWHGLSEARSNRIAVR